MVHSGTWCGNPETFGDQWNAPRALSLTNLNAHVFTKQVSSSTPGALKHVIEKDICTSIFGGELLPVFDGLQ